jgi:hypothetical protein
MSEERTAYECRVIDCKQGTHEWHQARLGKPTASKISCLLTPAGKPTANAARRRYAIDLAVERITKRPTETFCTFAMQRGKDMEDIARVWYFLQTNTAANQVGFCVAPSGLTGCSPDGLVGTDGAIEIKCPGIAHFAEIVATGVVDADWEMQCHHTMYVTGRKWIDFVLYTDIQPFTGWIKRIPRDPVICGKIHQAVLDFSAEVDAVYNSIVAGARLTPDKLEFPAPVWVGDDVQIEEVQL